MAYQQHSLATMVAVLPAQNGIKHIKVAPYHPASNGYEKMEGG